MTAPDGSEVRLDSVGSSNPIEGIRELNVAVRDGKGLNDRRLQAQGHARRFPRTTRRRTSPPILDPLAFVTTIHRRTVSLWVKGTALLMGRFSPPWASAPGQHALLKTAFFAHACVLIY